MAQAIDMKGDWPTSQRLHTFACNLDEGTPKAVRRALDIARTGFWYRQLVLETGKRTPYALGKHLQPETYRKNEHRVPFNHNLWTKYARGEVVPSASLLRAVDAKVPGSYANFRHVLFDVLNPTKPTQGGGDELLRRMHPGVQRAVFDAGKLKLGYYHRRPQLRQIVRLLEAQGHLDALAAAIVLLREAHEAERDEDVYELGVAVHHTLLITCAIGPGRYMDAELMLLVTFLVMRPLDCSGRRFVGGLADLCTQRGQLLHALYHLEDSTGVRPPVGLRSASKVVRGDYGDDLRWGLMPRLAADRELADLPATARLDVVRDEVFGGWARAALASYDFASFVPVPVCLELCDRLDAFKGPADRAP